MDWDDLRVFLAVARAESLSGAGKHLRIDPATVGRRIARLEEAMGARLFVKGPQGYALTVEGAQLLPHAERVEVASAGAAEALEEVRQGGQGLTGQIRIGAPDGCANYLLPQVLAQICDENPELELQIIALPRVVNLSRREADMAIGVSRPTGGRLTVQKLTDYRLHLAADRAYLAQMGGVSTLADLRRFRLVGYIPDMIFDKELDYLAETGLGPAQLVSNSVAVQLNWLRTGCGIGVVHDFSLHAAPGLVKVLPDLFSLSRSFWLIRHADDGRSARLSRFAERLILGIRRELTRLEMIA